MAETVKQRYTNTILFWMTIIGVPLALMVGIFSWMGLDLKLYFPISILFSFSIGILAYTIVLKGELQDKNKQITELKRKYNKKGVSNVKK